MYVCPLFENPQSNNSIKKKIKLRLNDLNDYLFVPFYRFYLFYFHEYELKQLKIRWN